VSKFARRPVFSVLPFVLLSLAGLPAGVAHAQDAAASEAQPAEKATPVDLLKDFIYYTRIDNYEVAAGYLRQLKDLNLKPVELVQLVEGSDQKDRFEQTVPRAMRKVELEELAGWLFKTYEQGKLERARDPEQIKANIALLSGTIRGRLLGSERLKMAGEYAMPPAAGGVPRSQQPGAFKPGSPGHRVAGLPCRDSLGDGLAEDLRGTAGIGRKSRF
jgi:hypothetical protein